MLQIHCSQYQAGSRYFAQMLLSTYLKLISHQYTQELCSQGYLLSLLPLSLELVLDEHY